MAGTGLDWDDAWSYAILSGAAGNWDGDTPADDDIQSSDAISLDGKAACIIGIHVNEPDGHAPAVDSVTIAILGDTGDAYENVLALAGAGLGRPMQITLTPIVSLSVYTLLTLDPRDYDDFKICIMNESGVNLVTTVQYKTATVPVAS